MRLLMLAMAARSAQAPAAPADLPAHWRIESERDQEASRPLRLVVYRQSQSSPLVALVPAPRVPGAMVEVLSDDEQQALADNITLNEPDIARRLRGQDMEAPLRQKREDDLARALLVLSRADLALELVDEDGEGGGATWTLRQLTDTAAIQVFAGMGPRTLTAAWLAEFLQSALGYGGVVVRQLGGEVLVRLTPGIVPLPGSSALLLDESASWLRIADVAQRGGNYLLKCRQDFDGMAVYAIAASLTDAPLAAGDKLMLP